MIALDELARFEGFKCKPYVDLGVENVVVKSSNAKMFMERCMVCGAGCKHVSGLVRAGAVSPEGQPHRPPQRRQNPINKGRRHRHQGRKVE